MNIAILNIIFSETHTWTLFINIMQTLIETQQKLKKLLAEGLDLAIREMETIIQAESIPYNVFIQLRARYTLHLNGVMLGITSPKEQELSYATLVNACLLFIDTIKEGDLKLDMTESHYLSNFGQLLYHIPTRMEVNREHKCTIRLSFDIQDIYTSWNPNQEDVKDKIRISDVMAVELINKTSSSAFEIIPLHGEAVQFLDKDYVTDWVFLVKPLLSGSHVLLLRIAAIEIFNGREVRRNVVLENEINVTFDEVQSNLSAPFIKTNMRIKLTNIFTTKWGERRGGRRIGNESESKGIHNTTLIATDKWKYNDDQDNLENYFNLLQTGFKQFPEYVKKALAENEQKIKEYQKKEAELRKAKEEAKALQIENERREREEKHKIIREIYFANKDSRPQRSGLEMQQIEGGTFRMKSTNKIVEIKSFFIGKYVLTQGDWLQIMPNNPSFFQGENYLEHPVENVSLDQIYEFLRQLEIQHPGKKFRLPTEAEWEYAACGGLHSQEFEYPGSSNLDEIAWYKYNSFLETEPVGEKKPNELGIFDMAGNVWEWCEDGNGHVLRGGAYYYDEVNCRVEVRYKPSTSICNKFTGFRLALS